MGLQKVYPLIYPSSHVLDVNSDLSKNALFRAHGTCVQILINYLLSYALVRKNCCLVFPSNDEFYIDISNSHVLLDTLNTMLEPAKVCFKDKISNDIVSAYYVVAAIGKLKNYFVPYPSMNYDGRSHGVFLVIFIRQMNYDWLPFVVLLLFPMACCRCSQDCLLTSKHTIGLFNESLCLEIRMMLGLARKMNNQKLNQFGAGERTKEAALSTRILSSRTWIFHSHVNKRHSLHMRSG